MAANSNGDRSSDVQRLKAEMPQWRAKIHEQMAVVREAAVRFERRAESKRA